MRSKRAVAVVVGGLLVVGGIGAMFDGDPEPITSPSWVVTPAPGATKAPVPTKTAAPAPVAPVETVAPEPTETRPGAPEVYARIEASTDCAELQDMFNTAGDNHDRAEPGSEAMVYTVAYMNAALDRLYEVGCY